MESNHLYSCRFSWSWLFTLRTSEHLHSICSPHLLYISGCRQQLPLKYKHSHSARTERDSCTGDVRTRLECSEAARTLGKRGRLFFCGGTTGKWNRATGTRFCFKFRVSSGIYRHWNFGSGAWTYEPSVRILLNVVTKSRSTGPECVSWIVVRSVTVLWVLENTL